MGKLKVNNGKDGAIFSIWLQVINFENTKICDIIIKRYKGIL